MQRQYWIAGAIALGIALLLAMCMQPSGYAHCVQVAKESEFNGQWLQANQIVSNRVVKVAECRALDAQVDQGNGERTGVVRWAECSSGPDCRDAGQF